MTRTLTAAAETALNSDNIYFANFIELHFDSGVLRVSTLGWDIDWNGYTWIGAGQVGEISSIDEGAEIEMRGISLTLTGIPNSYIATALGEKYQGRSAKTWLVFFDNNNQIIDAPVGSFDYRIDNMNIDIGETASISISCESRFADWERPSNLRYNNETHQHYFAGDKFFEYVPKMVNAELKWGRA